MSRLLLLIVLLSISFTAPAVEPDWNTYNALLKDVVSPGLRNGVSLNRVDYVKLRKDPRYKDVVVQLARFSPQQLQGEKEKLAFYINAYNILAIKVVLDHWPLESIRDAGSLFSPVWKKDAGVIGGNMVSLHQVEHEILRHMNEPRIHMAIVCASVSCPDLRGEAFTAAKLEQQLEEQTHQFLSNDRKGLRIEGKDVVVSKIFDWFEDDFDVYGGVGAFIKRYRQDLPPRFSIEEDLPYDWSLNKL